MNHIVRLLESSILHFIRVLNDVMNDFVKFLKYFPNLTQVLLVARLKFIVKLVYVLDHSVLIQGFLWLFVASFVLYSIIHLSNWLISWSLRFYTKLLFYRIDKPPRYFHFVILFICQLTKGQFIIVPVVL